MFTMTSSAKGTIQWNTGCVRTFTLVNPSVVRARYSQGKECSSVCAGRTPAARVLGRVLGFNSRSSLERSPNAGLVYIELDNTYAKSIVFPVPLLHDVRPTTRENRVGTKHHRVSLTGITLRMNIYTLLDWHIHVLTALSWSFARLNLRGNC